MWKTMNANEIWHATLGELELEMTKATFDTWVRPTFAIAYDPTGSAMTVGVHSPYAKEWLENRLHTTIQRTLTGIVGRSTDVNYVVKDRNSLRNNGNGSNGHREAPAVTSVETRREVTFFKEDETENEVSRMQEEPVSKPSSAYFSDRSSYSLNPKYTFDTFIIGSSNRLAAAAAHAVADNPGESYNPLFIYGGTGLGKTHLLHAIGQLPLAAGKCVRYVSSETFTNDMVNAIRTQSTEEFRQYYREIDVLLIDDIQFIAGKEGTQEEFFHTFNHLQQLNRQIVICSDRHPRNIATLEDRVRSRFEGGMVTDVQPPDLEMRIAILRAKAERQPVQVPAEVIDFIARKVQSNIRSLEGALTRVLAYGHLMNTGLSVEMATSVLQDILRHQPLTPEQVLAAVAEQYRVDIADLCGRGRSKEIVTPRQMAMYLLREETGASLPQIGDLLGGRDHTTVMYAHDKISEEIETNDQRRREALAIKEKLYQQAPV